MSYRDRNYQKPNDNRKDRNRLSQYKRGGSGTSRGSLSRHPKRNDDYQIKHRLTVTDKDNDDLERTRTSNATQRYQKNLMRRRNGFDKSRALDKQSTSDDKPKITIGEEQTTRPLLESKPHCKSLLDTMPQVFQTIVEFVKSYFQYFDNNRDGLLAAYHQKVLFSFSINGSTTGQYRPPRFGDHINESRNLKRVLPKEVDRRYKMLHQGPIDTVNCLLKLPHSEHITDSFKLDVCYFTQQMLAFSVSGVFKELENGDNKDSKVYRCFNRIFVVIPAGGGMSIVNEQYTISNITSEQYRKYVKSDKDFKITITNDLSNFATTSMNAPTSNLHMQFPGLSPENLSKIEKFSRQSNLVAKWAKDVLEDSKWDYDKAIAAFLQFKNQIPPDAYL